MTFLDREVERICESGVLGRSPVYARLLRYLNETTKSRVLPKEADIAVEVFNRRDFDPSTDSAVRVYLHNLRQKLNAYYEERDADAPRFLEIPRGEYRLTVVDRTPAGPLPGVVAKKRSLPLLAAGLLAALGAGFFAAGWVQAPGPYRAAADSALWQAVAQGDGPLIVVLGDYYIFGETGEYGTVSRLIRDFRINSRDDLAAGYPDRSGDPGDDAAAAGYRDMRLSYLPVGAGAALADVLGVVHETGREAIVIPASNLDSKSVQSSDIVYIGYLSGLGMLTEFVFAASHFELGATFDELIVRDSGATYVSEAGLPDGPVQDYVDYGFVSTFAGPTGNQLLVVAGMRDEGLMQMASILTSGSAVGELMTAAGEPGDPPGVEALYRVRGMNRMNIASKLVFAGNLDQQSVWIDDPAVRAASLPDGG